MGDHHAQSSHTFSPGARMPLDGCDFCDIVNNRKKDSPVGLTTVMFENDRMMIIKDQNPASNHHFLAIPKEHIRNTRALVASDRELIFEMEREMRKLFRQMHMDSCDAVYGFHWPPLYRVPHLHMHGIAPASRMGFLSRWVFKPLNLWFCTPQYVASQLECGCN